jgi:peptidyl-prolyl cis-trans isomerase D
LAKEYSEDLGSASLGGDLDWIEPGLMAQPFEDALYELTLEAPISEPVQTGFGWHVILLQEIRPSSGMSYEEARPTLIEEHQQEEAEREFLDIADRLVDIIYEDPTTLESAALELGLEIQTAGPFSRAGGEGIAATPEVVEAAFSDLVLLQESVSDPVDLGDNHMVLIKLLEHLPATIRPLEDVRDEIEAELRLQRAEQAAQAAAQAFLEGLSGPEEAALATVAEQGGLEVFDIEAAARGSAEPDPVLVAETFKLPRPPEGQATRAVLPTGNGFAVVVLEQVTDGQLEPDAALARQQYRRRVASAAAATESLAMLKQLRAAAQVEVFEDRLR